MSRWFCALLLACASAAQAAPDAENSEIMDRWLAEQGLLLTRIEDMGYEVVDRAQTVADQAADLVNSTMGFLGVPYKFGGSSAATGFDCSGFVRAVYEQTVGLLLPRRAEQQAAATRSIDRKELRPGDLVFFNTMRRNFSHVGIYVGDDKFIHAPHSGSRVRLDDLGRAYWTRRFNGARRVTPLEDAGGTQSAPQ
ncbi:peptidoglycan endopeptidase [Verminephrobacter aporrectodeae subsp. tuberculatae]|uniref:C40 family peptidase n=1 Tax=Verminephrobacter aporrectodeae TaxID=1110389 RepID=UPI0022445922|nr:C40 family peptidase [Verminephrobacter aporrectodeae]MCW8198484.1 peptidoglycan endopeptidase [Verminephrobacter aporrectodeae subsp. tuberculatae]